MRIKNEIICDENHDSDDFADSKTGAPMFANSSSFRRALSLARGGAVVSEADLEVCFDFSLAHSLSVVFRTWTCFVSSSFLSPHASLEVLIFLSFVFFASFSFFSPLSSHASLTAHHAPHRRRVLLAGRPGGVPVPGGLSGALQP